MRSPQSLLFCMLNKPNCLSLSLQDRCSTPLIIRRASEVGEETGNVFQKIQLRSDPVLQLLCKTLNADKTRKTDILF